MDPENTAKQNIEVYKPSFDKQEENLKSRENLNIEENSESNLEETGEKLLNLESLESEIGKLENSFKKTKEVIDKAGIDTTTTMKISRMFLNIPKLEHNELLEIQSKAPEIFKTFVASVIAADDLLIKEVKEIENINTERALANNLDEFNESEKKKGVFMLTIERSIQDMTYYAKAAYEKIKSYNT